MSRADAFCLNPSTTPHYTTRHTTFIQGPGRVPSSRSGEILDLSKDTFHHPAVRAPWCELSPPMAGWGSFEVLREGSSGGLRTPGGAYERLREDGLAAKGAGGATAIQIGSGRK